MYIKYVPILHAIVYMFINFRIKSAVGLRTVQATTLYGTGVFHKRFYPYSSETGLFEVVG